MIKRKHEKQGGSSRTPKRVTTRAAKKSAICDHIFDIGPMGHDECDICERLLARGTRRIA